MSTKVQAKGQGRLFQSSILESLTKTYPAVIYCMYIPLCALLTWYFYNSYHPGYLRLAAIFFSGLFFWTFFEYVLHRYVFHMVSESAIGQRFQYMMHGVHHEFPKDKERLIMPPVPSILISGLFFLGFRSILGESAYVFFSGFMIGYMAYAFIHYTMHISRPPKNRMRFFWKYHNLHHFRYHDKAYGVSSPLWDFIFRTMPPVKEFWD